MIHGLSWNARGISNRGTINYLKSIVNKNNISFCAVLEVKSQCRLIHIVARKLGFNGFMHSSPLNKHIWLFWKEDLEVTITSSSPQHISCEVLHLDSDNKCLISVIYASTSSFERVKLWSDLSSESANINGPWILMSDYNAIANVEEKHGGRVFGCRSSADFNNFIISNGLHDIGFCGSKFTWCNNQKDINRISMRLDRVLVNGSAINQFPDIKVTHLPRVESDHNPLLISFSNKESVQSFFSFNPAWVSHDGLKELIVSHWATNLHANPLLNCHLKLKALRSALRKWNWEVFGDINVKVADLSAQVDDAENLLNENWSEENEQNLTLLRTRLHNILDARQSFMDCKSHVGWLLEGDRNTKLFHSAGKVRRNHNNFKITLSDGTVTDDREHIGEKAVRYFTAHLGEFSVSPSTDYFRDIQPSITEQDNAHLSLVPDH